LKVGHKSIAIREHTPVNLAEVKPLQDFCYADESLRVGQKRVKLP